jgi:site-specific recombinase XerD
LLDSGCDLATIQRLLGHSTIGTTTRYLHVTGGALSEYISPLDQLALERPAPRR